MFIDIKQIAALLNVSVNTAYRYSQQDYFPASYTQAGSNKKFWLKAEVEAWREPKSLNK